MVSLAVVWIASLRIFIVYMYNDVPSKTAIAEAASFATQTVTTVGYGNWETHPDGARYPTNAISAVRAWSSVFMLCGATLHAVLTGLMVTVLLRFEP